MPRPLFYVVLTVIVVLWLQRVSRSRAAAKNTLEGLGGSIRVTTRGGPGTDYRIDLGASHAHAEG